MDDKIKVNDKRMFTPDGELREPEAAEGETRSTEAAASESASSRERKASAPEPVPGPDRTPQPSPPAEAPGGDPRDDPGGPQGDLPEPTFTDLVGLLAQPIAMFLGDARLPGGEAEENLPLARFHIDLLELLEAKTKGNISAQEAKLLENLLYQLRMRYLEKAG